jgi:hypothetical protein
MANPKLTYNPFRNRGMDTINMNFLLASNSTLVSDAWRRSLTLPHGFINVVCLTFMKYKVS